MRFQEEQIRHHRQQEEEYGYTATRIGEEERLLEEMEMEFLKSKYPCPTVNVTEKVSFKKDYFYLNSLHDFIRRDFNMRWGSVCFSHKYPSMHK